MISRAALALMVVAFASPVLARQQAPVQIMLAGGETKFVSPSEFLAGARPSDERGLVAPKVVTHVEPKYTREAMQQKIAGNVMVEAVVEKDGSVSRAMVTQSLNPDLDTNALRAAIDWKFQPGTLNGEPVTTLVHLSMEFRLH